MEESTPMYNALVPTFATISDRLQYSEDIEKSSNKMNKMHKRLRGITSRLLLAQASFLLLLMLQPPGCRAGIYNGEKDV